MTDKQKQCLLCYMDCLPPAGIDGIWGAQSAQATRKLQRMLDIPEDGIFGQNTEGEVLNAVVNGFQPLREEAQVPSPGEAPEEPLWWSDIKHFSRREFACKCGLYHDPYCDGYPAEMREDVVRIADDAREHFGRPAHVISGLRCELHNQDSDGVWNSQHMYGEAVDLMIEGVSADELLAYIKTRPGVRYAYAINGTNVHFDVPMGAR